MEENNDRFQRIKEHFSGEAQEFDTIITNRVPFYGVFMDALIKVMPFKKDKAIKVADLGSGTGTLAYKVKENFPNAEVACVDFSRGMLEAAKKKLDKYKGISYHESDILKFDFTGYDAVLSSLCLHHIGSEEEKREFFNKVYKGLSSGGVFYFMM